MLPVVLRAGGRGLSRAAACGCGFGRISGSLGAALSRPVTPSTYLDSDAGMATARLLARSWYGPAFTFADDR